MLLGPAGSGKSTFARYLALSLAGESLAREEASLQRLNAAAAAGDPDPPWPHDAALPVFVELKKLVRSDAFPREAETGDAEHLLAYLDREMRERFSDLLRSAFAAAGGALLILDGLDETPAAEACRQRLQEVIASFVLRYPETRVLVTSRPYAYEEGSP